MVPGLQSEEGGSPGGPAVGPTNPGLFKVGDEVCDCLLLSCEVLGIIPVVVYITEDDVLVQLLHLTNRDECQGIEERNQVVKLRRTGIQGQEVSLSQICPQASLPVPETADMLGPGEKFPHDKPERFLEICHDDLGKALSEGLQLVQDLEQFSEGGRVLPRHDGVDTGDGPMVPYFPVDEEDLLEWVRAGLECPIHEHLLGVLERVKAESRDEDDQCILCFTILVSSLNVSAKPKKKKFPISGEYLG